MVEGARLESVYIRKGIEGSNPSLSAEKHQLKSTRLKLACKTQCFRAFLFSDSPYFTSFYA